MHAQLVYRAQFEAETGLHLPVGLDLGDLLVVRYGDLRDLRDLRDLGDLGDLLVVRYGDADMVPPSAAVF